MKLQPLSLDLSQKRILIDMPTWVGDGVMATTVLEAIKEQVPDTQLSALCQPAIAQLLQHHPLIEKCYLLNRKEPSSFRKTIAEIRHREFSLLLLLRNSFSSAWIGWKTKIPHRIGFSKDCRSCLLTHSLPFPAHSKERIHQRFLIQRLLQFLTIPETTTSPSLYLSKQEKQWAQKQLSQLSKNKKTTWIAIAAGAAYGSAKCWLPKRWIELTKRLLNFPSLRILLLGTKEVETLWAPLLQDAPARLHSLIHQTTIRELMALISQCQVVLTHDSGPMHIASALRVPLLALFGPTNAIATGPYHGETVIQHAPICSPCYLRKCPLEHDCMKAITVEEVLESLASLIDLPSSLPASSC